MPVAACYFALAGLLPFSILLVKLARTTAQLLQDPGPLNLGPIALSTFCIAMLAAIDTGFAALAVRTLALVLHVGATP
jgi:hypothetical protein